MKQKITAMLLIILLISSMIVSGIERELYPPEFLGFEVIDLNTVNLFWGAPSVPVTFSEDFESGLPENWIFIDNDGDGYNWQLHSSGYESTGSVYSTSGGEEYLTPDNWMITPELVPSYQSQLTFQVKALNPELAGEHYSVKLSMNGSELSQFSEILYEDTLTDTLWHEVTIDLWNYDGICAYIGWNHADVSGMGGFLIDDIEVTNPYEVLNRELLGYNIYRNGSFAGDSESTNFQDIGLDDGSYEYYVTAVYDDGESEPSNTVELTICTELFDESFENGIPDNWTVINADNSYQQWHASTLEAHSGLYSANCQPFNQNDDWLITPPLMISDDSIDEISFYIRTYSDEFADSWEIKVSTTSHWRWLSGGI